MNLNSADKNRIDHVIFQCEVMAENELDPPGRFFAFPRHSALYTLRWFKKKGYTLERKKEHGDHKSQMYSARCGRLDLTLCFIDSWFYGHETDDE